MNQCAVIRERFVARHDVTTTTLKSQSKSKYNVYIDYGDESLHKPWRDGHPRLGGGRFTMIVILCLILWL